jgi:hypothetical protein
MPLSSTPKAGDQRPSSSLPGVATDEASVSRKRGEKRALIPPWILSSLAGGLALGCLAIAYLAGTHFGATKKLHMGHLSPAELAAMPDESKPLNPGPWGNLEYEPLYIEPPEEYIPLQSIEAADRRWRFDGYNYDQLTALFQKADLTDTQRAELLDMSKWSLENGALYVDVSKDMVLSLSPLARKEIYASMASSPGNVYSNLRCSFPADRFDDYLADSGLSEETIALVKRLSFSHGNLVFFCDMPLVLDTLQTGDEKMRLIKTLLRKSTLLLHLHITPDSNIDELKEYWARAGWGVDVRPMLESLGKLKGGARIDIVELFPPIPSSEIYNYTFPSSKPEDQHKDCRWTAMNFFRDVPDARFTDSRVVGQTLATDYYPVPSDPRYGDIIALARPNGDLIHFAVFIADNVVFTKNSGSFRDPFILMTLPDLLDYFSAQIPEDETLKIEIFRNKYY